MGRLPGQNHSIHFRHTPALLRLTRNLAVLKQLVWVIRQGRALSAPRVSIVGGLSVVKILVADDNSNTRKMVGLP